MAFPLSHKTVFVLDHSASFLAPCSSVDFDSIKISSSSSGHHQHHGHHHQQQVRPIGPAVKNMWTLTAETVMEYCRIVWDVFPPDCQEQRLIRFVSGDGTVLLTSWDLAEQNTDKVASALASVGRPMYVDRRGVLPGLETALKIMCEKTPGQGDFHMQEQVPGSSLTNRGRIVVVTSSGDPEGLQAMLESLQQQFREVNQIAASSELLAAISDLELCLILCQPPDQLQSNGDSTGQPHLETGANLVPLAPKISYQVLSTVCGPDMMRLMLSLVLKHYDLASTTVTGIPMKEEQNASSSANYDVELFHKASTHSKLLSSSEGTFFGPGSSGSGPGSGASSEALQNCWLPQTRKAGYSYSTITLKWCTPRGSASDLHNCTEVSRVTPTDVNSRPSSCLTNFLLNGRSVMLEMPRRSGAKTLSHMLTSHAGEIFVHTLNISRSVLDDPPAMTEGPGGRVSDYRIPDLGELLKLNRLASWGDIILKSSPDNSREDPLDRSHDRLARFTTNFPLTTGSTVIFNMAAVDPLQKIMTQTELTDENLAECRKVIYQLLTMENKGEPLPVPPVQIMASNAGGGKSKAVKKDEQYRMMFSELEKFVAAHCRTENHHKVLDCLLEVRNVSERPPTAVPRPGLVPAANPGVGDDRSSNLPLQQQQQQQPLSAKRPRMSGGGPGQSLLSMWTSKLQRENSAKHVPFAGERNLGEKAKLYLSFYLKEKDAPGVGGGPGNGEL